jgi:hypothetical protein
VASWPTEIETIKELIAAGNLENVAPSLEAAHGFLAQAAGHIDSARSVENADPTGAYSLFVRRRTQEPGCCAASTRSACHEQGRTLRDPGSHQRSVHSTATPQRVPPLRALTAKRNQVEYEDNTPITAEDVEADAAVVRSLHAVAEQMVDALPVFTD